MLAVTLEQFVKHLEDSGVLAGDTIKDFIPPKSFPKDAEEVARELVRQKKLTRFQAEFVWQGRGKSLVLGNYVLIDKIGEGGMGAVYKAEHRRMKRIVAIKMLPPGLMTNAAAAARFQREVEAAAKLRHPNIVAADDADEANGVHFLVMECVDGSDLSALVKQHGPVPTAQAVNYILQAARGLEFAHKQGVVHRDIKPANLLLSTEGTVKILDMGLARLNGADDGPQQAELTSTGTIMGTVDYMAPEQALDTRSADARADIYALGCSLFYLLTGKAAYGGDTLMKRLVAHREQPIPALRLARAEVPEQLEVIFTKMVAKKVEDRYQTMTAVIADLERCGLRQEQTVQTQPAIDPLADFSLTDFLQGLTSAPPMPGYTQTVAHKPSEPNWKRRWLLIGGGVLGALLVLAGVFIVESGKRKTIDVKSNSVGGAAAAAAQDNPWDLPAFKQWTKDVADMPPEEQVKAVVTKLQELNPEFDGHESHQIANGVVTDLQFVTDNITDISPVRALAGLTTLNCYGSTGRIGTLADLSPLGGLSVTVLNCSGNLVSDLSPLKGTKLTQLSCGFSHVSDLTPLREIPLTILHCQFTQVSDLAPLKGTPLTHLYCHRTPVTDLSPLAGLNLIELNCSVTGISDLSPLKGLPLTFLSIYSTHVADLSPLQGMNLKTLVMGGTGVSDLSPLRGMPLDEIHVEGTSVTDLSPLEGLSLTVLHCFSTRIADLSVLKNMRLRDLSCDFKPERDAELVRFIKTLEIINGFPAAEFLRNLETQQTTFRQWTNDVAGRPAEQQADAVAKKLVELNPGFDGVVTHKVENGVVTEFQLQTDHVTNISPVGALAGIKQLTCGSDSFHGVLADLWPLHRLPLVLLDCSGTQVYDLSPLRGMPLKNLNCNGTQVFDLSPLKELPLVSLGIAGTPCTDLSPLKDLPLTILACDHTSVADLSPLKQLPLTFLSCDFRPDRDTDILRSIKTLETINKKTAAQFWKDADEQRKAKAP